MSQETLEQSLSAEDVDRAVRRESTNHPVLALLDQLTPQIRGYNQGDPKLMIIKRLRDMSEIISVSLLME